MDSDSDPEYRPASSGSDNEPSRPPPPLPSPRSGSSARKRRHHRTLEPSSPAASSLPKRQKGPPAFNFQYLSLLNEEIGDAAAGIIRDEPSSSSSSIDLPPAQVGVTSWSSSEKHAFFSALDRLGRDDVPGIAARVGSTKSPLEIRQYLALLEEAERARRGNDGRRRRALRPVDIPAAVELSTEVCAALEQAADGIAARCERYEAVLEQKRWRGRWLVTGQLARVLENQLRTANTSNDPTTTTTTTIMDTNVLPPFAELFALRNWLRLSERVFMNSVVPDGNWRGVSSSSSSSSEAEAEAPSIRATALADFHSLAVSVTRRLVGATLYVAGSRVRAKRAGDRRSNRTSGLVKIRDVQAAVASVGMPENSRGFWARAARRLRLDVYDDERDDAKDDDGSEDGLGRTGREYGSGKEGQDREDLDGEDEDAITESDVSEEEEEEERHNFPSEIHDNETDSSFTSPPHLMSYDEVETALGFPPAPRPSSSHPQDQDQGLCTDLPEISSSSSAYSFSDSDSDSAASPGPNSDISMKDPSSEEDPPGVAQDLLEALTYTATYDQAATARSRDAVRARIRAEHALWAEAERRDARAAAREEARLWGVVYDGRGRVKEEERQGQEDDQEGEEEEEDGKERGGSENGDGRQSGLVDPGLGANWREHVEYYSEWEVIRERRGGAGGAGGGRGAADDANAKD
ncbi:hypothetical protein F4811DRAFT_570273 [Daldinia bambusicola]|nr:hypothetical protein F4811DRAFT_570273 [Daldinia bambusicola]